MENIIIEVQQFSKIRPNLWQARDGSVIGFGAILAPGGLYYCFTCSADDCSHVATVDEAWMAGEDSAEIPFDGMTPDEPLEYGDDGELVFASSADLWPDDYACEPWL